jgi:esterase
MVERVKGPQGELAVSIQDGRGAPILFVHSNGGAMSHWDTVWTRLEGRKLAAFDRRGHGKSDPPKNKSYALEEGAEDILAVADALGLKTFDLVAHSGGAAEAFIFAARHPDRVSALLLVDPPFDAAALAPGEMEALLGKLRGDAYAHEIETYYDAIAGDDPQVTARIVRDALATARDTVIGGFEALAQFRPAEHLGAFGGPRLSLIQSQYDADGALHRLDPDMGHIAIDGAGHWMHIAEPDRFCQVLLALVERVEEVSDAAARTQSFDADASRR